MTPACRNGLVELRPDLVTVRARCEMNAGAGPPPLGILPALKEGRTLEPSVRPFCSLRNDSTCPRPCPHPPGAHHERVRSGTGLEVARFCVAF